MTTAELPELHGIHAVVYALFDEHEELDRAAMRRQVKLCLAAGVHGMVALGLATEASKLSERERLSIIDWVAEDTAGKVPLGITVSGSSIAEQNRLLQHAQNAGADWLILQPPTGGNYTAMEYINFYCAVAQCAELPVAIQNAPSFLGRGLSIRDIVLLREKCPNLRLIKAEGSATEIAALINSTGGTLPVFNGRAGLELTGNLEIGCRGLILAPDCIDHAVDAYDQFRAGRPELADERYRLMAPAVIFEMQGIEHLICYGKRIFGARAGIRIHDRSPALRPSGVGLRLVEKHAAELGRFENWGGSKEWS